MRADPIGLGPARTSRAGPPRPITYNLCGLQSSVRPTHHLPRGSTG